MANTNMDVNKTAFPADLSIQAFRECECIKAIRKTCGDLKEANYFLDLASQYFNPRWIQQQRPKIIVLGTSFPAEIVYAFTGENPFWVFGGSRAMTDVSDGDVPRDTDPVARSMLGYLQLAKPLSEDALVIVPLVSDSQRKLAYILKSQGWNVETFYLPPSVDIGAVVYEEEVRRVKSIIALHLRKRFPDTRKAALFMEETACATKKFTLLASKRGDAVTGSLRMLVLGSYFMTQDVNTWLAHLEKLSSELSCRVESPQSQNPKMLVIGSPIYFPCYKVPFLLEDIGVDMCGFSHEVSGAFIRSDSLWNTLQAQIETLRPDGIIWHILKGQIEYDFELLRLEEYISGQMKLPVFRLETDYQYQDVEQLRVRMEAFAELLSHKKALQSGGAR